MHEPRFKYATNKQAFRFDYAVPSHSFFQFIIIRARQAKLWHYG